MIYLSDRSHFLETQHCYAMQLGNTRVWDYVGDNFVHRLLQNNEDGKLVEVEGNSNNRQHPTGTINVRFHTYNGLFLIELI